LIWLFLRNDLIFLSLGWPRLRCSYLCFP
jgi:hypothetical protein